ncbi:MAG: DUF4129 domain-containing protein [Ilumatobacteraceae bacterium]
MSERGDERTVRQLLVGVGLALAAFLAVAVSATGDPVPIAVEGTGGWHLDPRPAERPDRQPAEPLPRLPPVDEPRGNGSDVVGALIQAAALIAGGLVVLLALRAVRRGLQALPGRDQEIPTVPAALAAPGGPRDLTAAVDESITEIADGPVDDVIVACWVRLEAAAATGGIERRPSETAAELTVRVLDRFAAPRPATERLLELYRLARYSRHRLGEDDRSAALASLHELRDAIGVAA